jgi:hypothetical protein
MRTNTLLRAIFSVTLLTLVAVVFTAGMPYD